MKNKGLKIGVVLFALLFSTGVVYAATTGTLSFSGQATFTGHAELIFTDVALLNPRDGERASVNSILNDNKTLLINVDLIQPEDYRIVTFKIKNTGSRTVQLGELIKNNPNPATGVAVIWPNLDGLVVFPGTTSNEFQIRIYWDVAYYMVGSGAVEFSASIAYQQT